MSIVLPDKNTTMSQYQEKKWQHGQKLLAEAGAEEIKIILGWIFNFRTLTTALPENKYVAWKVAIARVLKFNIQPINILIYSSPTLDSSFTSAVISSLGSGS